METPGTVAVAGPPSVHTAAPLTKDLALDDIRWLVARRAEALHRDPDEATTSPGRPSSTTDAVSISAPEVCTGSRRADKALERSFRPQRTAAAAVALERFRPQKTAVALMLERTFDTRRMLERTFGTGRMLQQSFGTGMLLERSFGTANLARNFGTGKLLQQSFGTGNVLRSFDTSNVLRSFGTGKVMAELFSASRVEPVFDTGKVMANLFSASQVRPVFNTETLLQQSLDTRKLLDGSFGTQKVMANLFSAYRVGPVFDTRKLLPSFDTSTVVRSIGTGRLLQQSFDMRKLLEGSFDTRKLMANLWSTSQVGLAFDSAKVMANLWSTYQMGPAFDSGMIRVGPKPASAYPLVPTSPHGPIPSPADPGWLHQLLNDEERFRAVAPYLMLSSGGCLFFGLFLVALADPAVRAGLEILDTEASIGSLIVAVMVLLISQRK